MRRAIRHNNRGNTIAAWLIGLLLMLAATACGGNATSAPTSTTAATQPAATTVATTVGTPSQQPVAPTPSPATSQATSTSAPLTGETATVGAGAAKTFTNPVLRRNFPDPFLIEENGVYYAYATNDAGKNIQAAKSTDLVNWELLTDALPGLPTWARLGGSLVWAPEVIKIGDKFVMYYTARDKASNKQCIGVATADKPDGKFRDTNDKAFVCQAEQGGTIDASPFRDGGKLYLYYKNDGNCCNMPTRLWAQELSPDGLGLVGEPAQLIENDVQWEGRVVEAPTMWKQGDKYYLFYSGNNYAGFEYAVGYATCDTPMGPCKDAPENPILKSRMDKPPLVVGPGHQTLIQAGEQTWIIYHVWEVLSSGMTGSNRFMFMDKINWQDGKPVVQGPTTGPEPAP